MYPITTTSDIIQQLIDKIKNNMYNISKLDISVCIPMTPRLERILPTQIDDLVSIIEYADATTISINIVWKDGTRDSQKLVTDYRDYKAIRELMETLYSEIPYKLSMELESIIGGHTLRRECEKIYDIVIKNLYKRGKLKIQVYDRLYKLLMSMDVKLASYYITKGADVICLNISYNTIPTPEDIKRQILEYLNCH